MAVKLTRPRGTQDVLPGESWKWRRVEEAAHGVMAGFGYEEIRLPTFESTDVFQRGVGDTTDIVSKEMYTFVDKGGRSVTLRPEGTAGVARAVLENGLLNSMPLPLKMFYIQSCFRYEKAQKGRLREFHQIGVECYGAAHPSADAEVIALGAALLQAYGVWQAVTLEVNSIGCPSCRPGYHQALREYYAQYKDELCETCGERLEKNPMRLLDCKSEICSAIAKNAPVILDYLCDDCRNQFDELKSLLTQAGIDHVVNPRIVRGLDYYTGPVFEYIAEGIGTQGTVCAGGRYDGLVAEFGGQPTPAVGFAMGMERLLMLMEENGANLLAQKPCGPALYAVGIGDEGGRAARAMVGALRQAGLWGEYDISGRSVKAQMKAAGRLGALFTVVVGEDEARSGTASLKRMKDGAQAQIPLNRAAELVQKAMAYAHGEGDDFAGLMEE